MLKKSLLAAAAVAAMLGGVAAEAKTTLIYAARVITDPDKPALGPSTVTVTDGRIMTIEPGRPPLRQVPNSSISATRRCFPA